MFKRLGITSFAALFLAFGPAVVETSAQQAAPADAEASLTDDDLRSFAHAYLEVQEITQETQERMASAANAEEAQALQAEAQAEMTTAVQEQGLTTENYTEIVEVLNEDDALRERFSIVVTEVAIERQD